MIPAIAQAAEIRPFGPTEEAGIISLILDFPELYPSYERFLTPDVFGSTEARYVAALLKQDWDKHSVVPSRGLLRDRAARILTVDDPYDRVLSLIERPSDPREAPLLRASLKDWISRQIYSLLYSDEALAAHQRADYEFLKQIFESASRLDQVGERGFWFYDQLEELFVEKNIECISTGFKGLDRYLTGAGPSTGEVLVWLAPTNVGKTLMLCCNAVSASRAGHNVLFITFELSTFKTSLRLLANMSNMPLDNIYKPNLSLESEETRQLYRQRQSKVLEKIRGTRAGRGDIVFYDLPPDEHSVNSVYGILDSLQRTRGWKPKIVILDYLELMLSRRASANKDDYTRQKAVATEVRGLARNNMVLVDTATQTNRSGLEGTMGKAKGKGKPEAPPPITLEKQAESFGKSMPVDYVVSMNQSEADYNANPARLALFIAKNRNGPRFKRINVTVNYDRMQILEPV